MKRIDVKHTVPTLLALAMAAFFLWVFFSSDSNVDTEGQVKRSYTKQEVDEICAEYERQIEDLMMSFENSLEDYQHKWEKDAFEYGYEVGREDARESWKECFWENEGDFWHLYRALVAFWDGDTSRLDEFEQQLYNYIVECYHNR